MSDRTSEHRGQPHPLVALAGNPNTGKTTLFNALTGYRQRVGNYPGVTVEKKTGLIQGLATGQKIEVVDLPGAYSLAAHSADEAIVLDVLLHRQKGAPEPDVIAVVLDATNLSRNLFLVSQLLEIGKPVVVALNMTDLAEASGIRIDAEMLGSELGVPVVCVVATKRAGIDALKRAIVGAIGAEVPDGRPAFPECVDAELEGLRSSISGHIGSSNGFESRIELLQTLLDPGGYHEERLVRRLGGELADELAERRDRIVAAGESLVQVEARIRYDWIDGIVEHVVARVSRAARSRSEIVDRVVTHRVWGIVVVLLIMGMVLQAIYSWAAPVMDLVDAGFDMLGSTLASAIPPGAIQSLLVNGGVAGVGAVLVFLPQILILFLFLAILEDCGYMSRAAFMLDRWMGVLGLNGKSFVPLLSSFACAVPGIMATRTIEDRRDRFVTIAIAPLMSCSARLPIYILLIGALIPAKPLLGGLIGLQAVTLLAMYVLGVTVAVVVAIVLKHTLLPGRPRPFLMELPNYKWPSPITVLHRMYEQGRAFCVSAGTIIFAMAIVVWALGYYPHPASVTARHEVERATARQAHQILLDRTARDISASLTGETVARHQPIAEVLAEIEILEQAFTAAMNAGDLEEGSQEAAARAATDRQIEAVASAAEEAGSAALAIRESNAELDQRLSDIDRREAGAYLRQSLLGRMGTWIEPLVKPLGWDWRIGTAAIASFPAREVVVATLGTIYNLGADQSETHTSLREKLRNATGPDGQPVFNIAVALSLMVFFSLCCQCGATLATIKRETRSWRWPLFTFSYMTAFAYVGALVTYQIAIRLI